jgi:Domain of unknown function (DUF4133)
MTSPNYSLNKGVNRAIEFRGLKAQYIWWLGGGLVGLLAIFAGLYISGLNPFICIGLIGIAGILLFRQVYHMSRRYGQYGLMKKAAARHLPDRIRAGTRKTFFYGKRT